MKNKMEILSYTDNGWKVVTESGEWRIGYLNYCDAFSKEQLNCYERHHDTDEVFVLLKGEATLFIGDGDKEFGCVSAWKMELGKLYNIKKMAWHTQIMSPDCSILVIENRDTGLHNSDVVQFGANFRKELINAI